jgi:hypothetical protein
MMMLRSKTDFTTSVFFVAEVMKNSIVLNDSLMSFGAKSIKICAVMVVITPKRK